MNPVYKKKIFSLILCVIIPIFIILMAFLIMNMIRLSFLSKEKTNIITYRENTTINTEQEEQITEEIKPTIAEPVATPISNFESANVENFSLSSSEVDIDFISDQDIIIEEEAWLDSGTLLEEDLNATFSSRCSEEQKLLYLNKNGGNAKTEEAVLKALRWFKSKQNEDGSWLNEKDYPVGMTSLTLLAYLGHCETPLSEEFGESCTRAILYLINQALKNDYHIVNEYDHHWVYEHAFATYALAEAYVFCKNLDIDIPQLAEVVQKSGQIIIDNQLPKGTWSYEYKKGSRAHDDLSVTTAHIQALRACNKTELNFKGLKQAMKQANKGVLNFYNSKIGGFGYSGRSIDKKKGSTLVGAGILNLQILGENFNGKNQVFSKALRYVKKNAIFDFDTKNADLYQHYYTSQALINSGNEYWRKYNAMIQKELLKHQNEDGSWENVGGNDKKIRAIIPIYHGTDALSNHYRNVLCTLILEIYYRYVN